MAMREQIILIKNMLSALNETQKETTKRLGWFLADKLSGLFDKWDMKQFLLIYRGVMKNENHSFKREIIKKVKEQIYFNIFSENLGKQGF